MPTGFGEKMILALETAITLQESYDCNAEIMQSLGPMLAHTSELANFLCANQQDILLEAYNRKRDQLVWDRRIKFMQLRDGMIGRFNAL